MKLISLVNDYLSGVLSELKRVTFPTTFQVTNRTVLVIVSIAVTTLFIASVDAGIVQLFKLVVFKQGA